MPLCNAARTFYYGRAFGANTLVYRLGEAFAVPLHNRQQFFHVRRRKDA
jgi:hypothetical protein